MQNNAFVFQSIKVPRSCVQEQACILRTITVFPLWNHVLKILFLFLPILGATVEKTAAINHTLLNTINARFNDD